MYIVSSDERPIWKEKCNKIIFLLCFCCCCRFYCYLLWKLFNSRLSHIRSDAVWPGTHSCHVRAWQSVGHAVMQSSLTISKLDCIELVSLATAARQKFMWEYLNAVHWNRMQRTEGNANCHCSIALDVMVTGRRTIPFTWQSSTHIQIHCIGLISNWSLYFVLHFYRCPNMHIRNVAMRPFYYWVKMCSAAAIG